MPQKITDPSAQINNTTTTPRSLRHCEGCQRYLHTLRNLPAGRSKLLPRPKQIISKKEPMQKGGYAYIICSMNNTTLYVGVTSTIGARVTQHKENFYRNSFTSKYNCKKLVYDRLFDTIVEAITEEKRIKGGSRKRKRCLSTV